MHRPTIAVYDADATTYAARRGVQRPERLAAFARAVPHGARRLDLGCGPGHLLGLLGRPATALDASRPMLDEAAGAAPDVPGVQGDLSHLPFARHAFAGVWASKAHQHLLPEALPAALAEVHRILATGGRLDLAVFASAPGRETHVEVSTAKDGDDLPGRRFTWWDPDHLRTVVEAAGFAIDEVELPAAPGADAYRRIELTATAARALPDHVGGGMRLLCCGLNPSLHAADAGVGYITGSNRFWPAMAAAGLATRPRDPRHLLHHHRIGMTDLVKRPTARADELSPGEFRAGAARLEALCTWLRPAAVAVVGLVGWRAAVDRRAGAGWQDRRLGPTPVYLLPSTSGLNAGTSLDQLADHLRAAAAGPDQR